jgi:transcription termination factor Rho
MSVGQEFDPSLLERKDRAELVALAEALGEKPPARAKKADIIEHIMRLVGAGDAGGSADDHAPHAAPPAGDGDEGPAGAADATAPAASAGSAGDDADDDRGSVPASAPTGRNGAGSRRSGGGSGPVPQDRGQQDQDQHDQDEHDGDEHDQDDDDRGHDQDHDQDRGRDQGQQGQSGPGQQGQGQQGQGQQGQPGQGQPGQGQGPQGQGDADSPNRRRRRRGRDRGRGEGFDEQPLAEPVDVEGIVDLREEGYGFLRLTGYGHSRDDAYISVKQARQYGLRRGDVVGGRSRPANRSEKNPALLQVDTVNGEPAVIDGPERPRFEDLTPLFPDERLVLEQREFPENMTARIIDLLSPIGKGQRGLIVSPPKAGKTTVVKDIVRAIERNHPEVHVIVLLVDERPEEVTDLKRWVQNGEVAASTFDRPAEEHIILTELVIERAKRMVERGKDVVIVLDGITRLARAYNLAAPATGRIMAGGIDTGALYPPKKFFGAARNVEEGGSLTILATALVETNTRMDEVIFEEFKGTGNMEVKLDRRLAERRIFPAIDVNGSSTRHEELLYDRKQLNQIWKLRRVLAAMADESGSNAGGIEMLTDRLRTFRTNDEFLDEIAKTP